MPRSTSAGTLGLQILDNESLVARYGSVPFARVGQHWAELLQEHIEHSFLVPAETILEAVGMSNYVSTPSNEAHVPLELPALTSGGGVPPLPIELPPGLPAARPTAGVAELMFEVETESRTPTAQ